MSRALAIVCALSFPLSAFAAPRRVRRKIVPSTPPAGQQAFEQTFEFVLQKAGQSFLLDEDMPEPDVLTPFLANLREPELDKAKSNLARLKDLVADAEAVQQGPAGISPDVYKLMVDRAADDLGVGTIVEQEFVPNARSGRSLGAGEKALASSCQDEARNQGYDRRGFYQRCLGQRRAEAVYLNASRKIGDRSPSNAGALRLLQEIQAERAEQSAVSADVGRLLAQTRDRLQSSMPPDGPMAPVSPPRFQSLNPGGAAPAENSFVQAKGLKITEPPLDTADLDAGVQLARVAKADEIGFTGYCYSYVKAALQKVGIVDRSTIARAGAAGRAKQFAEFVDKNPALLKRKLRRILTPSWPLPIGTIVVWSPGACHYSAKSGHIEIVTRINPPQACSDGCGTFQTSCLDQLAADPARAASELPQSREDVSQAQSALDAATGRLARRRAASALARKKAALAALEARQEPAVAVYVIERPAQQPQ